MRAALFLALALAPVLTVRAQEMSKSPPPETPQVEAQAEATVKTLREANELLGSGDNDGALAKVNAALQANPKSFAAIIMRGAIYSKLEQWDQAYADYETAHLMAPHNSVPVFNLAEISFVLKEYDRAKPSFQALEGTTDLGDLAVYKVFLCDLFAGHEDLASRDLAAINDVGSNPSYYFANAAWDLYHHKPEEARSWLASAGSIYPVKKNGFYASSLFDTGYLPLPPEPPLAK